MPGQQEDDGEVLGVTAVSLDEVLALSKLNSFQRLQLAQSACCEHLLWAISTASLQRHTRRSSLMHSCSPRQSYATLTTTLPHLPLKPGLGASIQATLKLNQMPGLQH